MKSGYSNVMLGLIAVLALGVCVQAAPAAHPESTITSDEMEIKHNGAETFFRGHVILTDEPYLLDADEMTRSKTSGVVKAHGHLDGTWVSDKGEKVKAYGDDGFYTPTPPKTEMWGDHARMIRWETVRDTAPVQVVADHFTAYHNDRLFYALGHVVITQNPKVLTRSDDAEYDQKAQKIYLYGPTRVFVHVADAKGSGDFTGEKGWLSLDPKKARLEGHVQGHVIPGGTL